MDLDEIARVIVDRYPLAWEADLLLAVMQRAGKSGLTGIVRERNVQACLAAVRQARIERQAAHDLRVLRELRRGLRLTDGSGETGATSGEEPTRPAVATGHLR